MINVSHFSRRLEITFNLSATLAPPRIATNGLSGLFTAFPRKSISSKIPVIENLLDKVDTLIIGGGMAYTFMAAHGEPVGKSLLEEDYKQYDMGRHKESK